ncbi:hypothetical protein CL622_06000 [archaeon]|nr:hypothetical protein [archaeon]|tara:strand:- start:1795 stop:3042 length:1248 start_codon:yes stop_codon:yes gene_type:complete
MKESKKLRFLDRTLGSFICFIFSRLHFFRPKGRGPVKNILLIELFEMGVATMLNPTVEYIHQKIENPNIYCITLEGMKNSWKRLNVIPDENIYAISGKNLFSFCTSLVKQIHELRKKKIDLILDFELFMRIPAMISFMIKSKYRAGFYKYELEGLYRGSFYDFKCSFNQNTHISKNFLAITKTALNFEYEYPNYKGNVSSLELNPPKYYPNPILNKKVKDKIKEVYPEYESNKIIVIAPDVGGNLAIRNYPKENFVKVARSLLDEYQDHLIILCGTRADFNTCAYIKERVANNRCLNFAGKTSLDELFELIHIAELLISNDNGPVHFAAIVQTRTLALFSTDSPFMYGPLGKKCVILYSFYHCSPCISAFNHKHSKCRNNLCLQTIKPETVIEHVKKMLKDQVNYGTINNTIPYL